VFRDERNDDAGVDGSLELLVDGHSTNLRSQVQLKSKDSSETNADGSVSVQVKVSNLNYLLNGDSPIYVLYVAPRKELRFAWARDERKRLDDSSPGWLGQQSVTIRFQTLVTPETLENIYYRIGQEARLQRKVNDFLDVASNTEEVVVSINTATLEITDPDEVKRVLIKSGTAIVSAGHARRVMESIRLLDPRTAQEPRILLVKAHAESHLEQYQHAIATLADASLRIDELSETDKLFLQTLQASCHFQIGQISLAEFSEHLEQVSQHGDNRFALSDRLHRIRYALIDEEQADRSAELLEELRSLVEGITSSPDNSESFKILARIYLMEQVGNQVARDLMEEMAIARMKLTLGRNPDLPRIFKTKMDRFAEWLRDAYSLHEDAGRLGNPYLVGYAIISSGGVYYHWLTNQKVALLSYELPVEYPEGVIQNHIDSAQQAAAIFAQSGNLESELRAWMLIADFHVLAGRQSEALEIAGKVLPKAKIMQYSDLIWRAEMHLAGQSLYSQMLSALRTRSEREKVFDAIQQDDETVRRNAADGLRVLELPPERLPVMEREYFSRRDIAREKYDWCQHIELLEEMGHTSQAATCYRTDPGRVCICRLHGYQSKFKNQDWLAVISAFKTSYCEECPDRSPYSDSQAVE
jgi:hypothetical protein